MRPFENRIIAGRAEVRTAGDVTQIVGVATPFDNETVIANNYRERIMPGACAHLVGEGADIRSCFNHDPNYLLGRTAAGSLRVWEDADGLRYEADINPADPSAMSVVAKVQRGDVTGSSFRFRVAPDGEEWTRASRPGELPLRTITKLSALVELGPVTFPAYNEATAEARDMAASLASVGATAEARANLTAAEGEEAAELVQYRTAEAALAQAATALASAAAIVLALVTAETTDPAGTPEAEAAEEEVETAQLRSLLVLCGQVTGAVQGVSALAQAMLHDEYDPILYARSQGPADEDRARRLRLVQASR